MPDSVRALLLIAGAVAWFPVMALSTHLPQPQRLFVVFGFIAAAIVGEWALERPAEIREKRQAKGQCLECGYDLRASPDKCPECGSTPPGGAKRAPEPSHSP